MAKAKPKPTIPLSERLKGHALQAQRVSHKDLATDLLLAAALVDEYAWEALITQAVKERDPSRLELLEEATSGRASRHD
jgi:hypothetical protein